MRLQTAKTIARDPSGYPAPELRAAYLVLYDNAQYFQISNRDQPRQARIAAKLMKLAHKINKELMPAYWGRRL